MQLAGELSKVSLPNLLQLVKNGMLTGKLTFLQGAKTAMLFVENGNVVHAETDGTTGKEALMSLFLWGTGSFSFLEESALTVPRTLNPQRHEDSFEKLLRDGLIYVQQSQLLEEKSITVHSVLAQTGTASSFAAEAMAGPGYLRLDGRRTLAEALGDQNLSHREFVNLVSYWLSEGLATCVDPESAPSDEEIKLPEWVIARLRQDNANLSKAIIDMVIWVDRVKCWMYQVDADFYRIIKTLAPTEDDEVEQDSSSKQTNSQFGAPMDPDSDPGLRV